MSTFQEFKTAFMTSGVMNYPINELDEEYFIEHGKPPSGKYAKMLTRATPIADKIWKQILSVKTSMHDFYPAMNSVFTNRGIEFMVEQYAALNIELQDLNKDLKTAKQERELEQYLQRFDNVTTVNVFDMMVNDIEPLIEVVKQRNTRYNSEYTQQVEPIKLTVDDMKVYFKDASKAYKAKKLEILKRQKQQA